MVHPIENKIPGRYLKFTFYKALFLLHLFLSFFNQIDLLCNFTSYKLRGTPPQSSLLKWPPFRDYTPP